MAARHPRASASLALPPPLPLALLALLLLLLLAAPALAGPVATPVPTTAILMLPEVAEGLVVSFFLLGFALLGIFCVLGIQTPDVMHSAHLAPGKEY